jgi:hypothetical protein
VSKNIETSMIAWDDAPVFVTADEAIKAANSPAGPTKGEQAEEFLLKLLAGGPVDSKIVFEGAARQGISGVTLQRASKGLAIVKSNAGYQGKWMWRLPANTDEIMGDATIGGGHR